MHIIRVFLAQNILQYHDYLGLEILIKFKNFAYTKSKFYHPHH